MTRVDFICVHSNKNMFALLNLQTESKTPLISTDTTLLMKELNKTDQQVFRVAGFFIIHKIAYNTSITLYQ